MAGLHHSRNHSDDHVQGDPGGLSYCASVTTSNGHTEAKVAKVVWQYPPYWLDCIWQDT